MAKFIALLLVCFSVVGQTLSVINTGTTSNDGTGDSLRTAFTKANTNFQQLWDEVFTNIPTDISAKASLTQLSTTSNALQTSINGISTDGFVAKTNGTAVGLTITGANATKPISAGTTLVSWGDSLSVNASDKWNYLLAAENGWSFSSVAVGGSRIYQQISQVLGITVATNTVYATMQGVNDSRYTFTPGVNDRVNTFYENAKHNYAWLAIPDDRKIRASVAVASGTWGTDTLFSFFKTNAVNGSTLTFTNVIGSTVYLGYGRSTESTGGSFSVAVDGTTYGTFNCYGANPGPSITNLVAGLVRLPRLASGRHTVVVTVTSSTSSANPVYIGWASGNSFIYGGFGPRVYVGNAIGIYDTATWGGSLQQTAEVNKQTRKAVTELASDGLQVAYVDISGSYYPETDTEADGLHPSAAGYAKIARLFNDYISPLANPTDRQGAKWAGSAEFVELGYPVAATGSVRLAHDGSIVWRKSDLGSDTWNIAQNSTDLAITYAGADYLRVFSNGYLGLGYDNLASPVNYTFRVSNATGTDVSGSGLNIVSGRGTGSGSGGRISLRVSSPGASGTSINTADEIIGVSYNSATATVPFTATTLTSSTGDVTSANDLLLAAAGTVKWDGRSRLQSASDGAFAMRNNASSQSATLTAARVVNAQNSDRTVLVTESDTHFVNTSATNLVTFTLPAGTSGMTYSFSVTDADGLRVICAGTDQIRFDGIASGATGYIESYTLGSSVSLVWDGGRWTADSITGFWLMDGTARTTGTGKRVFDTSPQISQIELGHASANTLTASGGVLSVEGNAVPSPASPTTGQIIVYTNSAWVAMTPGASGIGGSTGSTDNRLLRADGTGGATLQNSAVLVDDFTSSTANNVAIKVDDGSTANIAAVITPKGTGAFILGAKPDGTATGGNARGARAVDLQIERISASDVASGTGATVLGGYRNSATSDFTVAGGALAVASGQYGSVALGYAATASGQYGSFATGYATTASGRSSMAAGDSTTANKRGQFAISGGSFGTSGDSQTTLLTARNSTSSTTPTVLFLDGSSGYITIPNNTTWTFTALLTGTTASGAATYSYRFDGVIVNAAGTTSMPVAVTKTVIYESNAAADADATANNTQDSLDFTVTAANSTATRWSVSVTANQLTY